TENISLAIDSVAEVSLFLEDPQQRADSGLGGWVGQSGHDVEGRRLSPRVDDVHDLPLSAAELRLASARHPPPSALCGQIFSLCGSGRQEQGAKNLALTEIQLRLTRDGGGPDHRRRFQIRS